LNIFPEKAKLFPVEFNNSSIIKDIKFCFKNVSIKHFLLGFWGLQEKSWPDDLGTKVLPFHIK
jgi:hypothetical protein